MRAFAAIILLCIAAAVLYGVAHDQVTARICIEYFTVTHPPLVDSTSPTIVALAWGVWATWWMGAFLGLCLALCARLGNSLPKLTWRTLIVPVGIVLIVMAVGAIGAGYALPRVYAPQAAMPDGIGPEIRDAWITCAGAHSASYFVGAIGGFALCIYAIIVRARRARAVKAHPNPPLPGSHP